MYTMYINHEYFSTIIIEVLNVQSETENESESNDYFFVEFTLRNEVGSLVSALEVFQVRFINCGSYYACLSLYTLLYRH